MHACIWNYNYQIDDTRNKAKYRNPDMKKDSEREEATCSCIKKLIYLTHICPFLRFSLHGSSYDFEMFNFIKNSINSIPSHKKLSFAIEPRMKSPVSLV